MKHPNMKSWLNHFENLLKLSMYYTINARSYVAVAAKYREQGNLGEAAKYLRLAGMNRRAGTSLQRDIIRCRKNLLEACHD